MILKAFNSLFEIRDPRSWEFEHELLHFQFSFWDSWPKGDQISKNKIKNLSILFLRFLVIPYMLKWIKDFAFQFSFWDSAVLCQGMAAPGSRLSILFLRFANKLKGLSTRRTIQALSILFLRFVDGSPGLQGAGKQQTFNSLFEIPA